MLRELPNLAGLSVATGDPATPDEPNDIADFAEVFQEVYEVHHGRRDAEHKTKLAPQASAISAWGGASYSISKQENVDSVAYTSAGDVTVTLDVEFSNSEDWFCDVVPGPTTEPIYAIEYDDGATRAADKARVFMFDNVGTGIDVDFLFDAYGPRSLAAAGLGTSAPAATGDVRNRLCSNDLESNEHRNKLLTFCTTKHTQVKRKHHVSGARVGEHKDVMVPIATALLRPGAATTDPGRVVWQEGAFSRLSYQVTDAANTGTQHSIRFTIAPPFRWVGVRVCPRLTSKPGNPVAARFVPRVSRPLRVDGDGGSRFHPDGTVALGSTSLSQIVSVGLVVLGYQPAWQE